MPFHNIFSKKKSKKRKAKQIPKIIADIHEKKSLAFVELSTSKQINLESKHLKIGDYLIGNTVIERKTVQDFIASMLNKRLFTQLKQMQKYSQQILIIEGIDEQELYSKETRLNPNSIRGFILSILTNHQIPIIMTQDYKDTAQYIITLAKQQIKKPIELTLHKRIPKTIQEQKQYILEAFPNIGPVKAKQLLKKFKTISNTINAEEEELREVLKNKTEEFKTLIRE